MTEPKRRVLLVLSVVGLLVLPNRSSAQSPKQEIPSAAQAVISAALGHDQRDYQSIAEPHGLRLDNWTQGLSAELGSRGVNVRTGADHWSIAVAGYGYGNELRTPTATAPQANANCVEYRRGELTEWYVNGPLGLEQGFTLARPPGQSHGEPLTLALTFTGSLTPSVDSDRRGLSLSKGGSAVLRYAGLIATDTHGRELQAWLEVHENRLRLRVDDRTAQYPVTVDPIFAGVITASDGAANDNFARSVRVSEDGTTIVAGAEGATINGNAGQGAAYVFVKPAGGWASSTETAKLTASDGAAGDDLGHRVTISGDGSVIALSATAATVNGNASQGAAYIYVRPGSGWVSSTETAKLTASDGIAGDLFGLPSISGDGNTLAIGANNAAFAGFSGAGTDYIFTKPAGGWTTTSTFAAKVGPNDPFPGENFGGTHGLSHDGTVLAAGAQLAGPGSPPGNSLGAAYVFATTTNWVTWNQVAKLTASDGVPGDQLGESVSISGDGKIVVAGAPQQVSNLPGAAYVFAEPGTGWMDTSAFTAKLTASNGQNGDAMGSTLLISTDGSTVVAGAPLANGHSGTAYVFVQSSTGWATTHETTQLSSGSGLAGNGIGVNSDASTIAVGANSASVNNNVAQGAASVFTGAAAFPMGLIFIGANSPPLQAPLPIPNGSTMTVGTVTLFNEGNAPLIVSAVNISNNVFTLTQQTCTASPIPIQGSCTVAIVATAPAGSPQFSGLGGVLTFTDNSGGVAGTTQNLGVVAVTELVESNATISSAAPNPILVGQAATITVSVASRLLGDTLTPSGNVTISASTGESCVASAPSGSCPLTFSSAGTRTISANYGGDSNFFPNTSSSISEQVLDFTLTAPSTVTVTVGGSVSVSASVGSLGGFSSPVSLTTSTPPSGISASFNPGSVTPPSGGSASSTLTVTAGSSVTPTSFTLNVMASSGGLTRSAPVSVSVVVNLPGLSRLIASFAGTGCIDNSGVANALTSKLSAAQAAINVNDLQTAINILGALEKQIQAQAGKHIATSCLMGGVTFNPGTALLADTQSLIDNLRTRDIADPITGYVLNPFGQAVPGATLSVVDGSGNTVATATTDITGFYYFPTTGVFIVNASYTIQVTGLAGFSTSNPASNTFTWQGAGLAFNYSLN